MAKILVADDEIDVGLIVTERLRRNGHDVDYASDGKQAIRKVGETVYGILILDVHMPGHSGYEVCAYSKKSEKNAGTPVLMMSAFPDEHSMWCQSHADAFLPKPFETGQLVSEVERLLKARP